MAWARVDDRMHSHPKFLRAGLEGVGLWALGLAYSADYLTDGFLTREVVVRFAGSESDALRVAGRLIEAGLWSEVDGGWQMHDYLDWNPSAKSVKSKRKADLQRKLRIQDDSERNPSGISEESERKKSVPRPRPYPTEREKISFDFDAIYAAYPRKEGKAAGLRRCKAQIHTQAQYERLLAAVNAYVARVRREGTEPRFIKHFGTFMGCWTDYAPAEELPLAPPQARPSNDEPDFSWMAK